MIEVSLSITKQPLQSNPPKSCQVPPPHRACLANNGCLAYDTPSPSSYDTTTPQSGNPSTMCDTFTASTVQNIDTITLSAGTPFPLWIPLSEINALVSITSGPDLNTSRLYQGKLSCKNGLMWVSSNG